MTDRNEESKPTAAVGLRHVEVSRPPTGVTNGRQQTAGHARTPPLLLQLLCTAETPVPDLENIADRAAFRAELMRHSLEMAFGQKIRDHEREGGA